MIQQKRVSCMGEARFFFGERHMFESKERTIVIPQYEHGRLSGEIAARWGNERFDRPAFDFASFVEGVAFHDWGYGVVDNLPIGRRSEESWLAVVRKGVALRFDSPISDIVAKLHIRRLLSWNESPARQALIDALDARVDERLPETGCTRGDFEWADKITRFCDFLAFDFAFENPTKRAMRISPKVDSSAEVEVRYRIGTRGQVFVNPWPFSMPAFSGSIIGYRREGYPEALNPLIVRYEIKPG